MSKILFLNRSFWPDTEATGVLLAELAEDLSSSHQVTVICGPANMGSPRMWPPIRRENYREVKVMRTFGVRISKRNLTMRLANLLAYSITALFGILREDYDVIVSETDPPWLGLLAAMVTQVKRGRFVYYCQDIYPEVAEATGGLTNGTLLKFQRWGNAFAYRRADAIVVLGADMAGLLRRKGVSAEKIAVIPNWVDCSKVRCQMPRADLRARYIGNFVVMYAGNLGWTQDLESVLQAANLLRHDARVKFVFVGDGARKNHIEAEARRKGLSNVDFHDRMAPNRMSDVLAAADLHLIPLGAGVAGCMVPSKVYGILAAGKPFVAIMERHAEVARIASEWDVGFVVPPGDAPALAKTISAGVGNRRLLEQMGARARIVAEQTYDRRLMTRRFSTLLEAVLSGQPVLVPAEETEVVPAMVQIEKTAALSAK